jgi:hypothetical protein
MLLIFALPPDAGSNVTSELGSASFTWLQREEVFCEEMFETCYP